MSAAEPGAGLPPGVRSSLDARWELLEELGRGAAGVVHRARERASGREVAIKLLLGERLDARRLERFRREGEITAGLSHPGIVRVHAAGEAEGRPWIAYELVRGGRTLREAWAGRPLRERVALVRDAARGLGHAHARGVVHRDLKPDNVLVDEADRVRVADFGLAAARGLEPLTRTGAMIGTPAFMAPEQVRAEREAIGPATDVWALGVVLYQALTGELPFDGQTLLGLAAAIEAAHPRPPRALDPQVPAALEAVCLHALSRAPADRPPDGEALAGMLEAWLAGDLAGATPPPGRGRRRALLGLLGLLPLGLLAAALLGPGDDPSSAPRGPARLVLDPLERPALEPRVALVGRVEGDAPWHLVRVGRESVRAVGGAPFRVEVPLEPGENRLLVRVEDPDGRAGEGTSLSIERLVVPAWLARLEPARRPPLPLPAGILAGEAAGEYEHERDGSRLVWIPPGSFRMGSDGPSDGPEPESPARRVTLTRGFFLGRDEVTWARWRGFASDTGRPDPVQPFPAGSDHPAVGVSWLVAREYCEWAGLRLPSEAEWEWAARGAEGRTYPWGEAPVDPSRANLAHPDGWERTAPVGSFPAGRSPEGCHDLIGNAWEWVADYFAGYPPGDAIDPPGPPAGELNPAEPELGPWRVHRGAGWNTSTFTPRAAVRARAGERYQSSSLGFRVAR